MGIELVLDNEWLNLLVNEEWQQYPKFNFKDVILFTLACISSADHFGVATVPANKLRFKASTIICHFCRWPSSLWDTSGTSI